VIKSREVQKTERQFIFKVFWKPDHPIF